MYSLSQVRLDIWRVAPGVLLELGELRLDEKCMRASRWQWSFALATTSTCEPKHHLIIISGCGQPGRTFGRRCEVRAGNLPGVATKLGFVV